MARRLLDGAIGGKPRVGIRRYLLGRERLRQGHDVALRRAEIFRIAAVAIETRKLAGAMHVETAPAGEASPAGNLRVNDHRIADLDTLDFLADGLHPACVLVPHD